MSRKFVIEGHRSISTAGRVVDTSESRISTPRILLLRSIAGTGGGAESIILRMAEDPVLRDIELFLCVIRHAGDTAFQFDRQVHLPNGRFFEIEQRGTFDRGITQRVGEVVRRVQPHIIDAHDYKAIVLADRITRGTSIRPMATLHGWTGHKWRERCVYYPFAKRIVRRFPRIVAVSSELRDDIIKWGAKPAAVDVVVNGIDVSQFQPSPNVRTAKRLELGLADDVIAIAGVGRLERQKRFDVMITAAEKLKRSNPPYRFFIVGEGSLEPQLRKLIVKKHLTKLVTLLGHRNDLEQLYQAFDCLCQSSDYEGTPTVVVEAMAAGIPVVATAAGGTTDLITDQVDGLVVPIRQPAALANAIVETFTEFEGTQARVERAREKARTSLSFATRSQRLAEIYRQLAQQHADLH